MTEKDREKQTTLGKSDHTRKTSLVRKVFPCLERWEHVHSVALCEFVEVLRCDTHGGETCCSPYTYGKTRESNSDRPIQKAE